MEPDDDICLCFHVSRRKVEQYVRVNRPSVASQLSECYGAGTGCGWCRPFLERIFLAEMSGIDTPIRGDLPDSQQYAQSRAAYREQQKLRSNEQ